MSWIKLIIKPRHPKVLHLAEATGKSRHVVYCAVLDWFFWIDEHVEDADTRIGFPGFREVTGWRNDGLANGMLSSAVDWLTKGSDDMLRPTRPESHFSKSAKQRALSAQRMANGRCAPSATTAQPRPDQTRPRLVGQNQNQDPESLVLRAPDSVGRLVGPGDPEVGKMIRTLGLNPTTEKKLLALTDLTGKEINEVYASVQKTPGIVSIAAVVAGELLGRRGIKLGRKGGPMSATFSGAIGGPLSSIEQIRRNRGMAS